jgi:hypothetical protein
LVVTEASKLVEPPSRESSQEFRSATLHLRFTNEICFSPNQRSRHSLLQNDRPFGRKSGVFSLRQVSNERRRIAFFDHISTGDHYRVVKLTDDCTSFCPWRADPVEIGIQEYMSENFGQFVMSVSKVQTRPRGSFVVTE